MNTITWTWQDNSSDETGFKVDPAMLKKLREQIERSAKYFNQTTFDIVKSEIESGAIENMTTEDITQEIWRKLDDRATGESRRIAATEMTRTDGWGSVEGYKQNEAINRKGWNCQMLDTSRETHIEMDGKEVDIDEDFEVGPEHALMAHPGDDRAPAGEVCNCRCSTYPVVGEI